MDSNYMGVDRLHTRLLNLGLLLNVLAPVVIISVGAFLKAKGVSGSAGTDLRVLFWALLVVALSEIPVIYIIKRSFLADDKGLQKSYKGLAPKQALIQWGLLIFFLSLAPTIYGFVYYLLGGTLERFVLFCAITLFCFLVFKPKLEEIRSFIKMRVSSAEEGLKS